MAQRSTPRNPLFDGRWFEDAIIIVCLRWYFRYKLSYRDLVEMETLKDRGPGQKSGSGAKFVSGLCAFRLFGISDQAASTAFQSSGMVAERPAIP